jgi:hypothetical protein
MIGVSSWSPPSFQSTPQILHANSNKRKSHTQQNNRHTLVTSDTGSWNWQKGMLIRVGFEPTRFLTSKLISGEPETSAITTRPSDQCEGEIETYDYMILPLRTGVEGERIWMGKLGQCAKSWWEKTKMVVMDSPTDSKERETFESKAVRCNIQNVYKNSNRVSRRSIIGVRRRACESACKGKKEKPAKKKNQRQEENGKPKTQR